MKTGASVRKENMKKNKTSVTVALSVSVIFLLYVLLSNGNGFNFLPYMIYRSISPEGGSEKAFIIIFDVIFACLICWVVYKLSNRFIK